MVEMIRRHGNKLAALALLLLVVPVGADDNREPDLGVFPKLQAPEGHQVAFVTYAEGVQIYRWNGTTWSFVGPEAVLYTGDDEDAEPVGIHYGGPTWESASGSKVKGAVVERGTPDASAIPWLLLRAVSNQGPGIFHRVTYLQRVYTVGGLAPPDTDAGDFIGDEARVPYTAWYVFYRAHQ